MSNGIFLRAGTGLAGLLLLAAGVAAQETDVASEIEELKRGQQQIRRELAEIKRLLEAAPRNAPRQQGSSVAGKIFELGDNPVRGDANASLILVEFSDYQ